MSVTKESSVIKHGFMAPCWLRSTGLNVTKICHPRQGRAATKAGDPGDLEKSEVLH